MRLAENGLSRQLGNVVYPLQYIEKIEEIDQLTVLNYTYSKMEGPKTDEIRERVKMWARQIPEREDKILFACCAILYDSGVLFVLTHWDDYLVGEKYQISN